MEKNKVQNRFVLIGIFVFFLICIILHFDIIEYKGQRMLLFKPWDIFNEFIQYGMLMGSHEITTEYGPITLYAFCAVSAQDKRLSYIHHKSFIVNKAKHALRVLNNDLPKKINVGFSCEDWNKGRVSLIGLYENIDIGGKDILADYINFEDDGTMGLRIRFNAEETIMLEDGTELFFEEPMEFFFNMHERAWDFSFTYLSDSYVVVKRSNETQGKKYSGVTFGKNWGPFIEGILYEEKGTDNKLLYPLFQYDSFAQAWEEYRNNKENAEDTEYEENEQLNGDSAD